MEIRDDDRSLTEGPVLVEMLPEFGELAVSRQNYATVSVQSDDLGRPVERAEA